MSNNANDDATNETNYRSSSEGYKGEDENGLIPNKAKEIGQSLKEKVKSVGKKTEEKTKELVETIHKIPYYSSYLLNIYSYFIIIACHRHHLHHQKKLN
jgi:hypothetical protein